MDSRFEVIVNGRRVCISGTNGDGVLSVILSCVKHPGRELTHEFRVGGLGMFDGSQSQPQHATWPTPDVAVGDEVTIRIIPAGKFDDPHGMIRSPQKTIVDPDFGALSYYIDSWDADIEFDCPPIESAHIHFRAGDSGPTTEQRDLFVELRVRYPDLWPSIRSALTRCHPEISVESDLAARLMTHLGISMDRGAREVRMSYGISGDPESRRYVVTVRDWEIVEVCSLA